MNSLRSLLTSKGTTLAAVVSGIALLFFDADFVALLVDLGVSAAVTAKLVSAAKLVALIGAALGYSPVKRPEPSA